MNGDFAVAVHALVFLCHRKETLASDVLAKNICTNPVRVRKVMAKLRRAGLVEAREGKREGGYRSLADAMDIPLSRILLALGDDCVTPTWRPGSEEEDCLISTGMADALDEVYARLNEGCLRTLGEITVADISRRIFEKRGK